MKRRRVIWVDGKPVVPRPSNKQLETARDFWAPSDAREIKSITDTGTINHKDPDDGFEI